MVWFYFGFSAASLYDFMASLFPAPAAQAGIYTLPSLYFRIGVKHGVKPDIQEMQHRINTGIKPFLKTSYVVGYHVLFRWKFAILRHYAGKGL